jgi:cytoskeletal protein CcmA (bactofilin family)
VIDIRLRSIATGKVNAKEETRLMVSEKIDAALEAGSMLVNGRRPAEVIDLYRKHVAANAARLS